MLDKADGGSPTFTAGYVQIFAESGSGYAFANGSGVGLTAGAWTDVTMNVTTPTSKATAYDPTQIVQVGVQIGTGGMPDGGVFGAHEALKLHIDSIVAQ
jgi:hypothetical protein